MNTQTNQSVDLNRLVANARSFIGLRRNLERLRNLCYLVIRRERMRRALVQAQTDIIEHQLNFIPKAPAALWQPVDSPDTSLSSSVSSFVAACAFSSASTSNRNADHGVHAPTHSNTTDTKSSREDGETRRLLLNAHVGDSFYENADVLDALELVYEQLCSQQERESWRRTRTEPAVRSEQAAAAMLKRTSATAHGSHTNANANANANASVNTNANASASSNVNAAGCERGSAAKPESRKRLKKQRPVENGNEKRKRKEQEVRVCNQKVKREVNETKASRKRKSSSAEPAVKSKRIHIKKENGFGDAVAPADNSSESSDSAVSDSEYETADENTTLPARPALRSTSSERESQAGSEDDDEDSSDSDDDDSENSDDNEEGDGESNSDGESDDEQSEPANESASESESESDSDPESTCEEADKENQKAECKPMLHRPRKRAVLSERRSPGGSASKTSSNSNTATKNRRRVGLLRGKNGLLIKCSSARPVSKTARKRDVAQANNAARKAALKKLKMSLKVNMKNVKLRPRNGLVLRVRLPAKAHS